MKGLAISVLFLGLSVITTAQAQEIAMVSSAQSSVVQVRTDASAGKGNSSTTSRSIVVSSPAVSPHASSKPVVINLAQMVPDTTTRISAPTRSSGSNSQVTSSSDHVMVATFTSPSSNLHSYGARAGEQYQESGSEGTSYENNSSDIPTRHREHDHFHRGVNAVRHECHDAQAVNKAEDKSQEPFVKTTFEGPDTEDYRSLDGTRMVKIDRETRDAYLYDSSETPEFRPLYLASGVESVEFSGTGSENSLNVVLKFQDGSYGVFDGTGASYVMSKATDLEPIDEFSQR